MDVLSSAAAPLTIADLTHVLQWGWDGETLADRIWSLRQDTMPGLPIQCMGDREIMGRILTMHPATWRLLASEDGQLHGCWHFLSLQKDSFSLAVRGQLCISDLRPEMLQSLDKPGWYQIHILTYAIRPQWRYSVSSLQFARSVFDTVYRLARAGIRIREMSANFVTAEGLAIGRALRLPFACDHQYVGKVYHGHVPTLLAEWRFNDRRDTFVNQLRQLYPAA